MYIFKWCIACGDMMHLLRKYDVAPLRSAMMRCLPMCRQARIIRRSRHHWAKPTSFAEGKHHSKNAPLSVDKSAFFVGGDGEIWTLAPVARPTPLAGAPLHHLSTSPCEALPMDKLIHLLTVLKCGGEGGIRTHAPLRTNGFQDRLVMTTSIPLRMCCICSTCNIIPQFYTFVKSFSEI